ncbi:nitrous oxide reductase accessory protein NosL [Maribacter algicola]|uniref:Nitrous oxide reductase accessory protein NosL n=1 Tax=Meishania litoralis TaxID=3434685 RepID=A0ACC7LH60_9FLAO
MKNKTFLLGFLILVLASCKVAPEEINYGSDACYFCSMTIVDQQHAAQIVTKKGKVFKFDASECMMNHLGDIDNSEIAIFLVNDYNAPGELIDATKATYLVSEGIPSPMGEFLTAFETIGAAQKSKVEHEGEIYSWEELMDRFKD